MQLKGKEGVINMAKAKAFFSMLMPIDAKLRLQQLAKERHLNQTQTVIKLIYNAPLEHPEEIGQITFDDIEQER